MSSVYDVIVLGGGLIGMSCAWHAAASGRTVAVVDPDPGGGASYAAAGMLAPASELHLQETALLQLNLAAAQQYSSFVDELQAETGQDVGYRPCGTLQVALDADDRARLADLRACQLAAGLDVRGLTGRAVRGLEPLLDPAVSGATLIPGDHQVDPRRLHRALSVACRERGVRPVTSPGRPRPGRVRLDDGTGLAAGQVVLAQGSRQGPPVKPVKGQILRLRMGSEPVLSHTVRGRVRDHEVYLIPRTDGELVIGATSEDAGHDPRVTAWGVYELLRDAQALVPAIGELEFVEATARFRPGTPDNGPLLGRTAPAVITAGGHYRNGVLLTAITGRAVLDLLDERDPGPLWHAFHPGRFDPATQSAPARPTEEATC